VAADLARAFIARDLELFLRSTVPAETLTGDYATYLDQARQEFAASPRPPRPATPAAINRVFQARNLSNAGPASMAYGLFEWQDLKFVDVEVRRTDGQLHVYRTLVAKVAEKEWRAIPDPSTVARLTVGELPDEKPSTAVQWTAPPTDSPH
jgi:hypothetical protein